MSNEKLNENETVLITGSAHPALAEEVGILLGLPVHQAVTRFADNEARVQIPVNVRGRDLFILQSTCPPNVDSHYMELFAMIDAARRASAVDISVVIPYMGYSRQERKDRPRTPINISWIARTIEMLGASRIVTVDLHSEASEGDTLLPWDNLYASYSFIPVLKERSDLNNLVVVSPDKGGVLRAMKYSELLGLGAGIAIIDKRRDPDKPNISEAFTMIGEVEGRDTLLVDDMLDTGGTIINAASSLKERGARSIMVAITHGLFSADAIDRIRNSAIDTLFIADTIPLREKIPQIEVVSVALLLTEAIECIHTGESISEKLFL